MTIDQQGFIDKEAAVWKPIKNAKIEGKIYFGFLAAGKINAENLWQTFFDMAFDEGFEFEIGIHCDKPFAGAFAQYVLPQRTPTTWADTIAAHAILIADAKLRGCDKFVLLSDSCAPLNTPKVVWESLLQTSHSFVQKIERWVLTPTQYAALPQKPKQVYITEQWFCADKKDYWLWATEAVTKWAGYHAGNELYLLPLFANNNCANGLRVYQYHHTNWNAIISRRSPKTYMPFNERDAFRHDNVRYPCTANFDETVISQLWGRYLFGRKFSAGCDFGLIEGRLKQL